MFARIRGWKAIVHDAIDFSVDMVEEGHESFSRNALRVIAIVPRLAEPARQVDAVRRATTSIALGSVRAANGALRWLTDRGLDAASALGPEQPASTPITMRSDVVGSAEWLSDAALGALNGAVGDYLHRESNPLDLGFSLRYRDAYLDPAMPASDLPSRLAVFVHGLGATEWSWCYGAESHGDPAVCFGVLLERDAGLAPIYARYNTGRRVVENGRLLADALDRLTAARAAPQGELVLIGHSMGGLVVQSACHYGRSARHSWVDRVSRVISLGAPHRGAPLEQLGSFATTVLGAVDLPGTRIPAHILRRRSAGVRDLARGTISDDATAPDLLDGIAYYFVSATVTRDREHPLGWLIGDVMVRVASASGPAIVRPDLRIETACIGGLVHQELQNHPDVYAVVRAACCGAG